MNREFSIQLQSLDDTKMLAQLLAPVFSKSPCSIALNGSLGSGKTTFTRLLLSVLGSTDTVNSPTYVLEHEYEAKNLKIEHWDVYRLKSPPDELLTPQPSSTLRLIEWADKFPELLELCSYRLYFSYTPDHQGRIVSIESLANQDILELCENAKLDGLSVITSTEQQ